MTKGSGRVALPTRHEAAAWVVYDDCDDFYLGAEKWVDDLWEALTFSHGEAEAAAEQHGGAELNIRAEPYAWHERPSCRPRDSVAASPEGQQP